MVRRLVSAMVLVLVLGLGRGWAQGQTPDDAAQDARIRASAQAAESLQGPLDGSWTLVGADGRPLYLFQIVDKSLAETPEGVWKDLRRPSAPGDIGLIDTLERAPDALTLRFDATTVSLKRAGAAWSGEMREAGAVTRVELRRQ
jgi:hypothetical protein